MLECARGRRYVAKVGDNVVLKLGPRTDMGDLKPNKEEGWARVAEGHEWCVWERTAA